MTVTLTYDPTLARVRITADGLAAADYATIERSTDQIMWTTVRGGTAVPPTTLQARVTDTFTRVGSNGWNTPDLGPAWVVVEGTAAGFSTNGTVAIQSHSAIGNRSIRADAGVNDHDATAFFRIPVAPTGVSVAAIVDLRARWLDNSNHYSIRINTDAAGAMTFTLNRTVGGSGGVLATGAPLTLNTAHTYGVRVSVNGDDIKAKFWNASTTSEPDWQVTAQDNLVAEGTSVQVFTIPLNATNPLPFEFWFDDVTVNAWTAQLDDYEFTSGVPNFYRVRGVETGAVSLVSAGTSSVGNNVPVTPGMPAGLVRGDAAYVFASIRNSGVGTPNTPAGWVKVLDMGNAAVFGRRYQPGLVMPTVSFSGGVANASTLVSSFAFRRAELIPLATNAQLNASAQDIALPNLVAPTGTQAVAMLGWKQDDWSSTGDIAGIAEATILTAVETSGDDAAQMAAYVLGQISLMGLTVPVTGGAAAISRGGAMALGHAAYLNEQTASTTPVLDSVWLKSVTRPFLNRRVTVVDWSPEERPSRGAGFPVVGRTLEVAVTDVAGGIEFDLDLYVSNRDDAQTLDYIRASGDILFLHTPAGCPVPGGHVCVNASSARRIRPRGSSRVFTLQLRQCAAPGPDVVGATNTWAAVLATYPSWSALLAANPTWNDLLQRIAPPSVVIVP